ncbi:hypothetical protein PWT90_03732 [Aphanocladium album]|nr:hypothetical protein PWT90_03732 [Aphanocladium album]
MGQGGIALSENTPVLVPAPCVATDSVVLNFTDDATTHVPFGSLSALGQANQSMPDANSNFGAWPEIGLEFGLSTQTATDTSLYGMSFSPTTSADSEASTLSSGSWLSLQRAMFAPKPQIRKPPTFRMMFIAHREPADMATRRISQLTLRTLKSYPLMIIHQKNTPPFLHPTYLKTITDDGLESWNNCMSLVYMANSKIPGSRKLFWRSYLELSKWELLATMQSLAIYVIMRLDATARDYDADIDGLLLRAVTVISIQLMTVDTTFTQNTTLQAIWEDWIFEESRRRLCVLFQVVNMVVAFEPADMCEPNNGIILAPLPAQKRLWEAPDHNAWKSETDMEPDLHTEFGLTKDGQLVKLDDKMANITAVSDERAMSASPVEWTEWSSGMDGIGNLVMLAASLRP